MERGVVSSAAAHRGIPRALILDAAVLALFLPFASLVSAQSELEAQNRLGLEPGTYAVGFRLLEERDDSRVVTGGASAEVHARPVRIYLWYPSASKRPPMRFGRYAALADDDVWPAAITGPLHDALRYSKRPLARSLGPAGFAALEQRQVIAAEGAKPLAGPFPLIVIGQGIYYESPITFAALAEYLAGRGFVVAATPLVGTNSPIVRVDAQDLENQVRDLELVIVRLRRMAFVSGERLGVLGFDQGGMAGVVLAMRNRDVDAFVSLDSGIFYPHPSGLPQASPSYDPAALRVPWLHAAPPRGVAPPEGAEVKSLFDTAIHSNRYLLVTDPMGHVDFTSYALIEERRAMPGYWADATPEAAVRYRRVVEYVQRFFTAFLRDDAESAAFLSRDPKTAFPGSSMRLEHRAPGPASVGYDELVQAVFAGRAQQAVDELRSAAGTDAVRVSLDEAHLERLETVLLYTWGLAAESLPLVEFTADRYPSSARAQGMLVDLYVELRKYSEAVAVLTRYNQQHPDDAGAQALLQRVKKLQAESAR